ncbi:MAG: toll/interleukin-1 receptor domain-containing protein [Candidatus Hydrogenedentes bacterium]|nr:toll/interleukin-1 receptor domain-containing protein [Candidatus Hydrogenedentota bacterium]
MATIREFFDTDVEKNMTMHKDWECLTANGQLLATVRAKIAIDFEANAKYWCFYIPDDVNIGDRVAALLDLPQIATCTLTHDGDPLYVESGYANYPERQSSLTTVFTRRVIVYIDADLGLEARNALVRLGIPRDLQLVIRDREYARIRSEHEKPLAFISHDSRDKDALVRELALEMVKCMCPVWYDEYSLRVGDSLRASIEKGLKETRKCVLVLSPNFLSNNGWGKAEFDSVFTREILEERNVILPVWHNVDRKQVYDYSPRLADRLGLSSSLGAQELARRLANSVKQV